MSPSEEHAENAAISTQETLPSVHKARCLERENLQACEIREGSWEALGVWATPTLNVDPQVCGGCRLWRTVCSAEFYWRASSFWGLTKAIG